MNCASCRKPMKSLGQLPIRVGGMTGGWHLLFGNFVDAPEQIVPLDTYRCSDCKRVEFFALDLSLPAQRHGS